MGIPANLQNLKKIALPDKCGFREPMFYKMDGCGEHPPRNWFSAFEKANGEGLTILPAHAYRRFFGTYGEKEITNDLPFGTGTLIIRMDGSKRNGNQLEEVVNGTKMVLTIDNMRQDNECLEAYIQRRVAAGENEDKLRKYISRTYWITHGFEDETPIIIPHIKKDTVEVEIPNQNLICAYACVTGQGNTFGYEIIYDRNDGGEKYDTEISFVMSKRLNSCIEGFGYGYCVNMDSIGYCTTGYGVEFFRKELSRLFSNPVWMNAQNKTDPRAYLTIQPKEVELMKFMDEFVQARQSILRRMDSEARAAPQSVVCDAAIETFNATRRAAKMRENIADLEKDLYALPDRFRERYEKIIEKLKSNEPAACAGIEKRSFGEGT